MRPVPWSPPAAVLPAKYGSSHDARLREHYERVSNTNAANSSDRLVVRLSLSRSMNQPRSPHDIGQHPERLTRNAEPTVRPGTRKTRILARLISHPPAPYRATPAWRRSRPGPGQFPGRELDGIPHGRNRLAIRVMYSISLIAEAHSMRARCDRCYSRIMPRAPW